MMTHANTVGTPIDSQDAWTSLVDWLPDMLSDLVASDVYGINNRPPKDQRGVYLFTERGKHMYVGRTSITARSRESGRPPITSFRHRFDQHTQPGRPPGAASFANRLIHIAAKKRKIEIPSGWWDDRKGDGAEVLSAVLRRKDSDRCNGVSRRPVRGRHQGRAVKRRRGLCAYAVGHALE